LVHRERDENESEVRELRKKLEILDLTHTALTKERNELHKEVMWDEHTHKITNRSAGQLINWVIV